MRLGTILPALAVALSLGHTAAADSDLLRQAADRAEIDALMWRYVRALDTLDADAYARVFTADGQFGSGENAVRGREALRDMVLDIRQGREQREADGEEAAPQMYHVITNAHVEFVDADTAHFHSYWMTVFGAVGPGSRPEVAAAGHGFDVLVRVDGQWLIRSRDVTPES